MIYIPPAESPHFKDQTFAALEGEINHFQTQGNILLVGDMNARIAEELDTTKTKGDKYISNKTNTCLSLPPRNNYDKMTNKHGKGLLQLCRALSLYIVNGRIRGDSFGRYIYSSSLGSSTVDYAITDLDPLSFRAFTVKQQTPFSDHNQINIYLK